MCKRQQIKEGYFKKVNENITPFDSNTTDTRDCSYVRPIYKWVCCFSFTKCNKNTNKL